MKRYRLVLVGVILGAALVVSLPGVRTFGTGAAQPVQPGTDPLPSWSDGPAKAALVQFVRDTTDKASKQYVRSEERIAVFDNDGTMWVEQPLYTQLVFALDRVKALAAQHPEWKTQEPFSAILADDREAMG